eukprot:GHRR01027566.1.p4 GENE.GHRR01027566.1~~GHRR01027566.1.p4  ORF type:complete len:143 (+),score=40.15 GHRR01027566.1:1052-1480(+)
MALSALNRQTLCLQRPQRQQVSGHVYVCRQIWCSASHSGASQPGSSEQPQQQHDCSRLINPTRRSMMMVLPVVAAAAAGTVQSAQAAGSTDLDNRCLECAGIGIVPCRYCVRNTLPRWMLGAAVTITTALVHLQLLTPEVCV